MMRKRAPKKVALVLSSGGARGIAHIGIIEELEKRGYEIGSVAGTSMGAFVGGMYASGNFKKFKDWMFSLSRVDIFKLFDVTISINGLVKGERLFETLSKIIPDQNIEDMSIPYAAVSTDIINCKEVVFDRGSMYKAIRASISIPTFFRPLESGDSYLVDGGLLNPTPIDRVKRNKGDVLIAVNVESNTPDKPDEVKDKKKQKPKKNSFFPFRENDLPGYVELVNKTIGIMLNRISELNIEKYNPDLVIRLERGLYGTYDFHKYEEIVERGREAAVKVLDQFESGK
ncbi:MAG: patatin-like phospholipase family protein [Prolixibacteraceae bacterium]|nr:patatin-like phospholipase family protein [Prolixibacteraceae bacterium]